MELLDRILTPKIQHFRVRCTPDEMHVRSIVEGQWGNVASETTIQCGDTDHVSSHGITPLKWMRRNTTGNWNSTRKQGKSAEIYRRSWP